MSFLALTNADEADIMFQYGDPNNSSRPGGPMVQAILPDTNVSNDTFRVIADGFTVNSLIISIASTCSSGNMTATVTLPLDESDPAAPRPEQAVQYYRASSVVLTLDGYNNTAALSNDQQTPNIPLPSWVNAPFLNCLNQTIGAAVPLIDTASSVLSLSPSVGLLVLLWAVIMTLLRP